MIDVRKMELDELSNLADTLDDVYYIAQRYEPAWLDAAGLQADRDAVDAAIEKQMAEIREQCARIAGERQMSVDDIYGEILSDLE